MSFQTRTRSWAVDFQSEINLTYVNSDPLNFSFSSFVQFMDIYQKKKKIENRK